MSNLDHRSNGSVPKKFGLDRQHGKMAGVCAGIARYFGFDPLLVRIVFAVGAIAGFGSFILLYLAIWALAD
ncbi:PspC domain-containing protein [Altererythrobacter sp. KTW20L]|uniref:PspC domain-containing protein n=1 Tax=Altererythrobacter sp. KTW20L TaxID=2942210 RepID=UPI0020BF0943|nr:PspC domain-containing protein [Altererythrobacter sp. KTW20L]MCL6252191.1 PspC domain-containing protein [Altererythrobacter sp. KTW20L]